MESFVIFDSIACSYVASHFVIHMFNFSIAPNDIYAVSKVNSILPLAKPYVIVCVLT